MITIIGPTASGKTQLAVALAAAIQGEIISADSRQVYRGMDLGTGKDLSDYTLPTGETIPYHLIDIREAGEKYNLFEFTQDFRAAYDDITSRGRKPILCGGTGLYVEAVLKDFRIKAVPEDKALRERLAGRSLEELTEMFAGLKRRNNSVMHNTTDIDTPKRAIRAIEIEMAMAAGDAENTENAENAGHPESLEKAETLEDSRKFPNIIFAIDIPRDLRRERITRRLDQRLADGMLDEVKALLDKGIPPEDLIYYGLEYKFLTLHLTGQLSFDEMRTKLEIAIHQFAKRQMTWFRGMEKRGLKINWIDFALPMEEKVAIVLKGKNVL